MTTEEKIKKAEQELNKAKMKLATARMEASKERRAAENRRKYMMGGLVAKYLREDMAIAFMDLSEEEITRIVAGALKQRDIQNLTRRILTEREAATPVMKEIEEYKEEEGSDDDE